MTLTTIKIPASSEAFKNARRKIDRSAQAGAGVPVPPVERDQGQDQAEPEREDRQRPEDPACRSRRRRLPGSGSARPRPRPRSGRDSRLAAHRRLPRPRRLARRRAPQDPGRDQERDQRRSDDPELAARQIAEQVSISWKRKALARLAPLPVGAHLQHFHGQVEHEDADRKMKRRG